MVHVAHGHPSIHVLPASIHAALPGDETTSSCTSNKETGTTSDSRPAPATNGPSGMR